MRILSFIFINLVVFLPLHAQDGNEVAQTAIIEFEKNSHDFGTVNEGGPITYEFKFTNKGKVPLTITNVKASCGCTTPSWTKEPVQPGKTGFITAQYNTANRPGPFNKTLTVMANTEPAMVVLTITGNVIPRVKTPEELYPKKMGNLRLFSDYIHLGKITTKEPVFKEVILYNEGTEPLQLSASNIPSHIEVTFEPQTIGSKEKASMKIRYNGLKKNDLGPVEDELIIVTNEASDNKKILHISADINEYYPPLSGEEALNAPRLVISSTKADIGNVKINTTGNAEVDLTNNGKQELILKKVRSGAGYITVKADKMTIKPGQTVKLKISYKADAMPRGDTQFIWIHSNDPAAPTQSIMVNAAIVKE
jgi:hypothetical protein